VLDDYSVAVAQADDGDLIDTFAEEGFYAEGLAFAPAGDLLALVSRASLKLWRPGEPTALRTLTGDPDTLLKDVAFSPDGQFVAASAWYTDLIQLWSVATGEPTMVLSLDSGIAQSLAFSPDGSLLAAGMFDGSIRLWSLTDGRQTATLQGPASPIGKLVFAPDGQTLAVGGQAGQLTLWTIADQQSRSLPQQTAAIHSLTYAADGRQLLVVLEDGLTQHWQLSDGTLLGEIGQPACGSSTSASCCTVSATTSSSSADRSTPTIRPDPGRARPRRASLIL
jgi:WD40 repeat protein